MVTPVDNWFVEDFDLRSPTEEFEEYCQSTLQHLREGSGRSDAATHQEAISLVLGKLHPSQEQQHVPIADLSAESTGDRP